MQRNSRMGNIITALESERDNINEALEALGRKGPTNAQGQRATPGRRRRRRMSPAARRRISEMMKKRWAERKRKAFRAAA